MTTIFPRQGHYALDAELVASYPAPDVTVERIGDLIDLDSALLADVGQPETRRRTQPAASAARRDDHEHDDRHHVRQRVRPERRRPEVDVARLELRRQRLQRAEEVRTDEAELGRQNAKITSAIAIQPAPPVIPSTHCGVIASVNVAPATPAKAPPTSVCA